MKTKPIILPRGIKRKGTQGRYSEYYKVWNKYNPDNFMPENGYVIHHKDGNPNNNHISNLQKMTDSDHKKLHVSNGNHPNQGKKYSKELKEKLSISHLGQTPWNKGKTNYLSKESRYAMGSARRGSPSICGMQGKKHSEETIKKMKDSHQKYLERIKKEKDESYKG